MGTALGVISCAVSAAKGATKLEQQLTGGRAGTEQHRQRGTAGQRDRGTDASTTGRMRALQLQRAHLK